MAEQLRQKTKINEKADMSTQVMQKLLQMDAKPTYGISKSWMIIFMIIVIVFISVIGVTGVLVSKTLKIGRAHV